MLLKVEQGHKDRFAMLSPQLLELVGAEARRLPTSFLRTGPAAAIAVPVAVVMVRAYGTNPD